MTIAEQRHGRRFEGWPLVGWSALLLTALVATVLATVGAGEEGVRSAIRATARTSIVLFALAFSASSLRMVWRGDFTEWLVRNRRYVGVSFAVSHALHLVALLVFARRWPASFAEATDSITLVAGGLAYLVLAAMTATSFDRSAAWLGPVWWKRLHLAGGYYLWAVFAVSYLPGAAADPRSLPLALVLLAALALRLGGRLRRPRHELPA